MTNLTKKETKKPEFELLKVACIYFFAPMCLFISSIIIVSTFFSDINNRPPSDSELEETFINHECEFNQLIEMSKVDSKVLRIALNFTWLDDESYSQPDPGIGFSNERWDEYKELFTQLKLKNGLQHYPDNGIFYLYASNIKGYAYSTTELSPLLDSLDNPETKPVKSNMIYKKLKDNWYIYYDNN